MSRLSPVAAPWARPTPAPPIASTGLASETLTRREREVLALLVEGLTAPEIAERLFVATSSVKSHLQHLYGKLGVTSKRQAVSRAQGLGWLPNPPRPWAARVTDGLARRADTCTEPLSVFFGRVEDVARAQADLGEWRLVTLTGPGGVGKSRLARRVAEAVGADFPDGVWFAALAGPALVASQVALAVGLGEVDSEPLVSGLARHLRERRGLLVLDNCEHLLADCAGLAESLLSVCPRLRILATSREPLGIAGEAISQVAWLPFPSGPPLPAFDDLRAYMAIRLLVERTRALVPGFALTPDNAPWLARICQRLDGIPLALEMAAAGLRLLDAQALALRLDHGLQVLTGGSRTAPPRHQTLRASLDWSYALLSPPECLLLRRLSVFAEGWSLEAAEAVCAGEGLEAGEVLQRLAALVAKSLVVAEYWPGEAPRYRLLEMVNQYAREKMEAAGESQRLQQRRRAYCLPGAARRWPSRS